MKLTRKNWLQYARRAVQLALFIIFPGLFAYIFSTLGSIIKSIIAGTFTFSGWAGDIVLLAGVFLVTAVAGREFCGFICSFGAAQDLFWFLGGKFRRVRISEKADRWLRGLKYVLLAAIVVFDWLLGMWAFDGIWSPWTAFGVYSRPLGWTMWLPGAILLILIFVGSMFFQRFFCRYLCPLGAIFNLISRARLYKLKKSRQNCGACRACTISCPMGLELYKTDVIDSGDCIDCMKCAAVCPRSNVRADPRPSIAALAAAGVLTGFYFAGNLTTSAVSSASESASVETTETVSPEITAPETASSETSSSETSSYETASSETSAQSAAQTSAPETTAAETTTAETTTAAQTGKYTDGTYTGSGTGLRGTTSVTVTVSGGVITSIEIDSYQDDSQYFNRAKSTIISEILKAQSVDVSTVSGATFSSNGILEAVADALSLDFTNPNSTMSFSHGRG